MQTIRLFVSSPSDVAAERERVDRVVNRIQSDYPDGLSFEVIRWEENYYSARSTFQDQIASPAETDLVVCVLWKRLGSALPDVYRRPDGSSRTGTEFEFETAMEASLRHELPDILLYRKTAAISFRADRVDQERAELQALEGFWRRWIQNEKGHFTAGFKQFETTDAFERQLEKDLRAWLQRRFHQVEWPEAKGSPYRGLAVFEEEHAAIFFGRRRAVAEVRARLIAQQAGDGVGFLLVIGASGSGKSSLIRAGLVPALRHDNPVEGVAGWRVAVFTPGELGADPLAAMVNQLSAADALPELLQGDYQQPSELATLWSTSPALAAVPVRAALHRWGRRLDGEGKANVRLLLVVDQLEEIFQLPPAAQAQLLAVLDQLARSGEVWVIATLRNDFYPRLFDQPVLLALKANGRQYDLGPPSGKELHDIITGPARAAGLRFEADPDRHGLDQTLLDEAGDQAAALPLLEFTLDRLYRERDRNQRLLTYRAYDALGGLEGALTTTAEEAFATAAPELNDDPDRVFARVMRELVSLDTEGRAVRRVAPLARLHGDPDDRRLTEQLLKHRLVRADTQEQDGEPVPVVDVTHEALISHWDRVQRWLEQDRNLLRIRERMDHDRRRWVEQEQRPDLLAASGKRLEEATTLSASGLRLEPQTQQFVERSLHRGQQLQRRRRWVQAGFAVLVTLSLLLGIFSAFSHFELADQQARMDKQAEELAEGRRRSLASIAEAQYAQAELLRGQGKRARAVALLTDALQRLDGLRSGSEVPANANRELPDDWLRTLLSEPRPHLRRGRMQSFGPRSTRATLHATPVTGRALLLTGKDKNVQAQLLSMPEGKPLSAPVPVVAGMHRQLGMAFSPDGRWLAAMTPSEGAEESFEIRVLDLRDSRWRAERLTGVPSRTAAGLAFLGDAALLVAMRGEVREWRIESSNDWKSLPIGVRLTEDRILRIAVVPGEGLLINNHALYRQSGETWAPAYTLETPTDVTPSWMSGINNGDAYLAPTSALESPLAWALDWGLSSEALLIDWLPIRLDAVVTPVRAEAGKPQNGGRLILPVPDQTRKGRYVNIFELIQPLAVADDLVVVTRLLSGSNFNDTNIYLAYRLRRDDLTVVAGPLALDFSGSNIWDAGSGRPMPIAVYADEQRVIIADDQRRLRIIDWRGQKPVQVLRLDANILSLARLPGDSRLFIGTDQGIQALDLSRAKRVTRQVDTLRVPTARRLRDGQVAFRLLETTKEIDTQLVDGPREVGVDRRSRLVRVAHRNAKFLDNGTDVLYQAVDGANWRCSVPDSLLSIGSNDASPTSCSLVEPAALVKRDRWSDMHANADWTQPFEIIGPEGWRVSARRAIGLKPGTLTLRDAEGNLHNKMSTENANPVAAAFSPDGEWLVYATDRRHLVLLEKASGRELARFKFKGPAIRDLAVSKDGWFLHVLDKSGGVTPLEIGEFALPGWLVDDLALIAHERLWAHGLLDAPPPRFMTAISADDPSRWSTILRNLAPAAVMPEAQRVDGDRP